MKVSLLFHTVYKLYLQEIFNAYKYLYLHEIFNVWIATACPATYTHS